MKTTKFLALLCVIMLLTSCNQNEPSSGSGSSSNSDQNSAVYYQLLGTKWEMISNSENGVVQNNYVQLSFMANKALGFSYTVSNKVISGECKWWTTGNDSLLIDGWPTVNNTVYNDATVSGFNSFFSGAYKITYLSDTEMRLHLYSAITNGTRDITYRKISGSSGGGGGSSQGVTDLYLYDYTEWPTKIKVVYKYQSDISVTSAKIYYGEYSASKSVNATVSSTTITATISGLQKNTVYYVKASATTSKGTVYSQESRVMTAIE